MPKSSSEQVTDRVLRLAAYIAHERVFTLDKATIDVEGYGEALRNPDGSLRSDAKGYDALRSRFRRDLEILRAEFGIEAPYDSEAARYELRPPFFTPSERRALIAAAGAVVITLEGETDADPEVLGSAVDDDRAEVFLTVTPDALSLLKAQRAGSPVTFTYRGKARVLEPWAVGTWRRHWYVVGNEKQAGPARRFRIDRITDLEVTDGHFDIPPDFDSDAAFDMDPNAWGDDPRVTVRIEVDAEFADRLADAIGGEVISHAQPKAIVEAESTNRDALTDRLLELGPRARLVDPPEVVAEIVGLVRAMAAR